MSYSSVGTWSQHNLNGGQQNPAILAQGNWSDTPGETAGGNNAGGQYSVDAGTSGTVTVTLTWVPTTGMTIQQDPPSPQVILQESGYAQASVEPYADCISSDGIGTGISDTKYELKDGTSGTITVSDSLYAFTPTAAGPPYNGNDAVADVAFTVTPTPVEVDLTGVTQNGNDLDILTGQQVTAVLSPANGDGSGFTVSGWNWSAAGGPFETYDPTRASGQLVALTAMDKTQESFNFYTKAAEDAKVTCNATITCPDNTVFQVAPTRDLKSVKPTAAVTINAAQYVSGFFNDPGNQQFGVTEIEVPAAITVPAPFSGGTGCFAQIVTPLGSFQTSQGANYVMKIPAPPPGQGWIVPGTGLDFSFPYPSGYDVNPDGTIAGGSPLNPYTWDVGANPKGGSADKPKQVYAPDRVQDWSYSSADDTFTTWVMYRPPAIQGQGTVWVPLVNFHWSWSATATKDKNGVWTINPNHAFNSDTMANPTVDPPHWTVVIAGETAQPQ